MPEYPGGHEAMFRYIADNLHWTDQSGSGGKVFVAFTVEENGALTEVAVLRSMNVLADAEALRLVKMMPSWKPGLDFRGEPIRQRMVLPIQICAR